MATYKGTRTPTGCVVTVGDRPLDPHNEIINHSPDGFEWGYEGSGPAQLAFALLFDRIGCSFARQHYQQFKQEVIAQLKGETWTMTGEEIDQWLINKHK